MHVYAAVLARDRPTRLTLTRHAVDSLQPLELDAFRLRAYRVGAATLFSLPVHDHLPGRVEYVSAERGSVVAYNGYPIVDGGLSQATRAAHLGAAYRRGRLPDALAGGFYSVIATQGDELDAWTCLSNTEPLYVAQTSELAVVGNRASMVQRLAFGGGNEYDLAALVSMCPAGWPVHSEVPFRGVRLVAPGSHVRVGLKGPVATSVHRPLPLMDELGARRLDAAAVTLAGQLVASVKALPADSVVELNLSGGKDSRLVLAACWRAGVNVRCLTAGLEQDPEVIVAREVAEMLGVEHTWTAPEEHRVVTAGDLVSMLDRQVSQGEGLSSVYNPCYPIRDPAPLRLVGHGGELYKGGFDSMKAGRRPLLNTPRQAARFMDHLSMPNAALLTDAGREIQSALNWGFIDEAQTHIPLLDGFYDYAYLRLREGRAQAATRQASSYGALLYSPLLDDRALREVWSNPVNVRAQQVLFYKTLDALHPQLARLRFADSRWRFEQSAPHQDFDPDGWSRREPPRPGPATQARTSWRHEYDGGLRGAITDLLLSSPTSPIFDIVDRAALEKQLAEPGPTSNSILRSIYGTLTAQHLLSDAWVPTHSRSRQVANVASTFMTRTRSSAS